MHRRDEPLKPGDLVITPTGFGAEVLEILPMTGTDPWPRALLKVVLRADVCTLRCELLARWPQVRIRAGMCKPLPGMWAPRREVGPETITLKRRAA